MSTSLLDKPAMRSALESASKRLGAPLSPSKLITVILSQGVPTLPDTATLDSWAVEYVTGKAGTPRRLDLTDELYRRLDVLAQDFAAVLPDSAQRIMRDARSATGFNRSFTIYLVLRAYGAGR